MTNLEAIGKAFEITAALNHIGCDFVNLEIREHAVRVACFRDVNIRNAIKVVTDRPTAIKTYNHGTEDAFMVATWKFEIDTP